ncbi:MAG: methyltransferase domain-containing protein [Candidatus Parcubacteria bacterium]|nr:methyltransferase domain-containing protein [Candidatus Parcubacteria bacterium]
MIEDKIKLKKYIFSNLDFKNIKSILDLGCGNCDDLKFIQELFPRRKFKLYGVDRINNKYEFKGINYITKDLNQSLPFENETFDLIYSHNLLECIRDKEKHISEMHRVLKPNGCLVCSHVDWDTQLISAGDKTLTRKILISYADNKQSWMDNVDAWAGRRLYGNFNGSKLFYGEIKAYSMIDTKFAKDSYCYSTINSFRNLVKQKIITQTEYNNFREGLLESIKQNTFFYSNTCFIYYGRKNSHS